MFRMAKSPVTAPFSALPIALATQVGHAQHPSTAITVDDGGCGPKPWMLDNTKKRLFFLVWRPKIGKMESAGVEGT